MTIPNSSPGARASRPHRASPQDGQDLGARASRPHRASPLDWQIPGAQASRPHQPLPPPLDEQIPGARASRPHRAWHSRGYLPHIDTPGAVQFVTFRLADSMPGAVLAQWKSKLARMSVSMSEYKRSSELRRRIERYLDSGYGACWLRDNRVAQLVEDALLHFDGARYNLLSWVAMPNHVHALLEVFDGFPLDGVIHSWKSFSAKRANRILGRKGRFWASDCFDRQIRDDAHFAGAARYIERNPVKAGLVESAGDWRWGSASKYALTHAGGTPALPGFAKLKTALQPDAAR